jgi:type I protein arginine methyltransferase
MKQEFNDSSHLISAAPLDAARYARVIDRHVRPEMVVAVLGSGSGLLACLAARRGARVYALGQPESPEQAPRMSVAGENIHPLSRRTRDFHPGAKIDLILHTYSGLSLLESNVLEELFDLKKRLLKSEGRILPGQFSLFFAPIELRGDPGPAWERTREAAGSGSSCFKPIFPVASGIGPWEDPGAVKLLAPEQYILDLDFQSLPLPEMPDEWECQAARIEVPGRLDGFLMSLQARFENDAERPFGSEPALRSTERQLFRCESREAAAGNLVCFQSRPVDPGDTANRTWEYALLESGDQRMR